MPLKLLLLPASLTLLVAAVAAHSYDQWDSSGARLLCHFELPSEANCSLQGTAVGSCIIHKLSQDNCFRKWTPTRDSTLFIEGLNFTQTSIEHKERITTVLKIYNYKGTRLLIITMLPEETWWQVDVPKGEHNITITGLQGSLNETTPVVSAAFYEGCPPPRINYKAFRQWHKMEILITPLDEHMPYQADASVSVQILSSNETNFSDCNSTSYINQIALEYGGVVGGSIFIEEMYSTEFCFTIKVNSSDGQGRRYACGLKENMTVPPFSPAQAVVEPPAWWAMGLVFLVILLALTSLCPRAVQKGLAARRRGRGERGKRNGQDGRAGRPLLSAPALLHGGRGPSQPPPADTECVA